ncbi:saccharopine dehydrogenase [Myxococcaceae bacterium GXIMD 01537]
MIPSISGDAPRFDPEGPVVLAGGYGVVGTEVARLLRAHHPELPLALAGRTLSRAEALAAELGGSTGLVLDLDGRAPLTFAARAVVGIVNDSNDRLLRACLRAGIPYVDITRWTARLQQALVLTLVEPSRAPAVFASGWMGGLVPLMAATLGHELGGAETIETSILYDLADRSGADSVDFMDRMWIPYEVTEEGSTRLVEPLSECRRVHLAGRGRTVARLDTPEQFTLPRSLGARTVSTRIGFNAESATLSLIALKKLGIFSLLRSARFRGLRHGLLHNPGSGGLALVRVSATRGARTLTATLSDPRGQAHLTAVGALLGLRRALGLDGAPAPAGAVFPEQTPSPADVPRALRELGVEVAFEATAPALAPVKLAA